MTRVATSLLILFVLVSGLGGPRLLYACEQMDRMSPECCCLAEDMPCGAGTPEACGCCEVRLGGGSETRESTPPLTAPRIEPPTYLHACLLAAPELAVAAETESGAAEEIEGPGAATVLPLYLKHCVLLC